MLFWGIFGALTLRAVFIFAGSALISKFWWLLLVFGVFLVYTGIKVIHHRDDEDEESAERGVGLLRRFVPVTDKIEGHAFFTRDRRQAGRHTVVRGARRGRGHRRDLRRRLGAGHPRRVA